MTSKKDNNASFNNSFNSSWSSKDWKDNEEKRKQYELESGKPTEFASPGAMGSPSTGRKSLKKKWNNTPVEESAQRCSDWLSPPSDELAMASPGRQKRRSYTIKKEIPAPNLDD